jgi:hypothetical protein
MPADLSCQKAVKTFPVPVEGNVQGVLCRDRNITGRSGADLPYFF